MDDEARNWLAGYRCPFCTKNPKSCPGYKVKKTYDGWRCWGFRSKYQYMSPLQISELRHG